jgi:hypothetical protein
MVTERKDTAACGWVRVERRVRLCAVFELPEIKQPRDFARWSEAKPTRKSGRRTKRVTELLGRTRRAEMRPDEDQVGLAGQPKKERRGLRTMLRGL